MKHTLKNLLIIVVVLGITGAIRMPIEQKLSEKMKEDQLIPPGLSMEDRAKLKQKGFAAAFGSFRPTLAAFTSLNAVDHFSNKEWDKIEGSFTEATILDPRNTYYWDIGSWHLAVNASSDLKYKRNLSEIERDQGYRKYIQKGKDFLDRGIKANPNNWEIHKLKADLLANYHRLPDYPAALNIYDHILTMDGLTESDRQAIASKRLYTLEKIPSMHQEAYDTAYRMFHDKNRKPDSTLLMALYVGQNHPLNKVNKKVTLQRMYDNDIEQAYKDLTTYWINRDKLEQVYGVKKAILNIEKRRGIPPSESFFRNRR